MNIRHLTASIHATGILRIIGYMLFTLCCIKKSSVAQIQMPEETRLHFSAAATDSASIMQRINNNNYLTVFHPDSAIRIYQDLLNQSNHIGFHYGAAASLLMISNAYRFLGQYGQALEYCGEALAHCHSSSNAKRLLAFTYNQTGMIYQAMGERKKAAYFIHLAIRAKEQFPNSDIFLESLYINLSSTLNKDTLSLYYLHRAISLAEANKNSELLGISLINMALQYHRMDNPAQYLHYLQKAYTLGIKQEDTLLQYRTLMKLAHHAINYRTPEEALAYIHTAHQLKKSGDPEAFQHNANQYMTGHIFFELKQFDKAVQYWKETLETATAMHIADQEAETHMSFARLYSQTGNHAKAYEHQARYLSLKDSLMNTRIARDINQLEVEYRTAEKDKLLMQAQYETERKNFLIILITGGTVILTILFIAFYWHTRQKQKMLQQEKEIGQLKNVMKGEEKERGRIAQELHDGIGGMLGAIKMQASRVRDNPETEKFNELMRIIDETAGEVRRASHNLLPGMLEKHNLEEALILYCDNINKNTDLHIEIQFYGATDDLSKSVTLVIYRIAQELIQNIIKHAQASIADVQVTRNGNLLNIIVEDNGVGFNTDDTSKGIGLFNMRHRVRAMRGYMSIDSIKGRSTTIFIEFDLENLKLEV